MRDIILTSLITGFFLAFMKWDFFYMGTINWIFASIVSFVILSFLYFTVKIVGKYYGYDVTVQQYYATWEKKYYSHIKKEVIEKKRKIPIGYLIMLLFGFLSSGIVFPIITYTYKFSTVEAWRIGKTKELELKFSERVKIILISLFIVWTIFGIVKYLFMDNFFLKNMIIYSFHILSLLTITYVIPFCLLLSYLVIEKLNGSFSEATPGDLFMFSEKPFYKSAIFILILLPLLSYTLPPLLPVIILLLLGIYIWLREKYRIITS